MKDQVLPPETRSQPCDAILAQVPDAIIFADRDGVIRLWNRGAEVLFGFPAADVIGSNLDVIIPEQFRQAVDEVVEQQARVGRVPLSDIGLDSP